MNNFIYVFSASARDTLLDRGYMLLKSDDAKGVYVFVSEKLNGFSREEFKFALPDGKFALTDKLTF